MLTKAHLPVLLASLVLASCNQEQGTEASPPGAVSLSIIQSSITQTSVSLIWTRSTFSDFQRYEIYASRIHGFGPSAGTLSGSNDRREDTMAVVGNLDASSRYYFKVRTFAGGGKFADSNEETARTADPPPGASVVRFIHASHLLPSRIVIRVDTTNIDSLAFNQASAYRPWNAGTHKIVLLSGSVPLDSGIIAFVSSWKSSLFILDKLTAAASPFSLRDERYTFSAPVIPDSVLCRFVNASISVPQASLHSGSPGGELLAVNIGFGRASSYLHLTGGTRSLFLTGAGDTTSVSAAGQVTFDIGRRYTVAAMDSSAGSVLTVYIDD